MDRQGWKLICAVASQATRATIADSLAFVGTLEFVDDGWRCLGLIEEGGYQMLVATAHLMRTKGCDLVRSLRSSRRFTDFPILLIADRKEGKSNPYAADRRLTVVRDPPLEPAELVLAVSKLARSQTEQTWVKVPEAERRVLLACRDLMDRLATQSGALDADTVPAVKAAAAGLVDTIGQGGLATLLAALGSHDDYTFSHNLRVSALLVAFGLSLKVSVDEARSLAESGLLHDIGKLSIPLTVLAKPGPLTAAEWTSMKDHPRRGEEILGRMPGLAKRVVRVAAEHHERLDGSGYPKGLKGSQIGDLSVIAAIADVYSALTDRRAYKPPMAPKAAFEVMRGMAGHHLEPHFLTRFIEVFDT